MNDMDIEMMEFTKKMQAEETEMKLLDPKEQKEPDPKPGKGNAVKGYKEDYQKYAGSMIHTKVMYHYTITTITQSHKYTTLTTIH